MYNFGFFKNETLQYKNIYNHHQMNLLIWNLLKSYFYKIELYNKLL